MKGSSEPTGLIAPVIPVTQNGTNFLVGISGGKGGADPTCKCGGIYAVKNPLGDPTTNFLFPFATNTIGFDTGIAIANGNASGAGTVTIVGATSNGGSRGLGTQWHINVTHLGSKKPKPTFHLDVENNGANGIVTFSTVPILSPVQSAGPVFVDLLAQGSLSSNQSGGFVRVAVTLTR